MDLGYLVRLPICNLNLMVVMLSWLLSVCFAVPVVQVVNTGNNCTAPLKELANTLWERYNKENNHLEAAKELIRRYNSEAKLRADHIQFNQKNVSAECTGEYYSFPITKLGDDYGFKAITNVTLKIRKDEKPNDICKTQWTKIPIQGCNTHSVIYLPTGITYNPTLS
ncbi:uncharacterized protein LOC142354640 [Convolutriloba macropyga]|uniref:uncharacterized protein LOC142354640 n=1 Tax=Convolutriloba macropyga TaxID=536237 RepID=UPI003F524A2E